MAFLAFSSAYHRQAVVVDDDDAGRRGAMDVGERAASGPGAAGSLVRLGEHDVIEDVGPTAHLSANGEVRPHLSAKGRTPSNCGRLGAESPEP
ncbi:hypothetical protein E2562_003522 [Oryza meyeriana var. granulata]|uniref:Uncharacterized protein n=1 Tax=Oryza meyeriana var. granulata TaxID=110450 RepID=A0A6G1CP08_9ORYZ|nr:hypothetical protein E2562_003522 [Oryza meyeriana var. granulata]